MLEVTLGAAAFAGLLSFLSPCILPIVPFYLSYLGGLGMHQVTQGAPIEASLRRRAVFSACAFSLGVITIFVALGASATLFGQLVRDYFDVLRYVAAALIIAMGLHFLGWVRIPILYRQMRAEVGETGGGSFLGAYVIGLAFAFGWTPCVGPVLAAILFTAAGQEGISQGALLLFTYGAGMTAPFILAAVFIGPFMRAMARFRPFLPRIEQAMGLLLILFGILIATNSINLIAQWMLETFPIFMRIG